MTDIDFDDDLDAIEAAILAEEDLRRSASRKLPPPAVGSDGGDWRLRDGSPLNGAVTSVEGRVVKASHSSACARCSGRGGSNAWPGWTCFRCRGSTVDRRTVRLYAPHQVQALADAKAARIAERIRTQVAEAVERDARAAVLLRDTLEEHSALFDKIERTNAATRSDFAADVLRTVHLRGTLSDGQRTALMRTCDGLAQLDEDRRTSRPVGTAGDRTEVELTCQRIKSHHRTNPATYAPETVWFATYRDRTGAVFLNVVRKAPEHGEGDVIVMRGTVKEHREHDGVMQTVLMRTMVRALVRTASKERAISAAEKPDDEDAPRP